MITVNFSGGFGNNIKQYIVGCLIAKIKNKRIKINNHAKLINPDSMNSIFNIINNDMNSIPNIPINLTLLGKLKNSVCNMESPFDMKDLYKIREYINENMFNWENYEIPFELTDNDIVISLRLGMNNEVVRNSPYLKEFPDGLRIPFTYYSNILDKHLDKRIIICCDDFDNDFLKQFEKYSNIVLAKENTLIQFQLLRKSKFIISPHSSFSHMAIFLSEQEKQDGFVFYCDKNCIKSLTISEFINT